ncbi:MAG: aminodeoxychorismate synthase component I [Armatimonadetes bacterium]|nr:aminodeoxychorismate synthase component I [Armatimonadota bacterium]
MMATPDGNYRLPGLSLPARASAPRLERLPGWVEPVRALRALCREPAPVLLESLPGFGALGRYSILAARPFLRLTAKEARAVIHTESGPHLYPGDFFEALAFLLDFYRAESAPEGLPFAGGAIGYLGYDLGRMLENIPVRAGEDPAIPEAILAFYDTAAVFDHEAGRVWLLSVASSEEAISAFRRLLACAAPIRDAPPQAGPAFADFTPEGFCWMVRRVKEYIAAGDIYQANLTQRFYADYTGSPLSLYDRLRRATPAPFAACLDFGEAAVVSASPERFLSFDPATRRVETRPIKGTRPRGAAPEEDDALASALQGSDKDRAENVMIVDLERSDLGRVCDIGSVEVPHLWSLEAHPTVWHLVSAVTGRLTGGCDRVDLLKATFPGGSITGAPKVRAMEIIEEMEPVRRGVYTGAIGYFDAGGHMDLNIAIRTFVLAGGKAYFHAGAGIVADSDPESEYRETLDKARALFTALGLPPPG